MHEQFGYIREVLFQFYKHSMLSFVWHQMHGKHEQPIYSVFNQLTLNVRGPSYIGLTRTI